MLSRPTCHYAYHPCDDAVLSLHEFAGKNWRLQDRKRLMMEEITSGIDELGVLLMGPPDGVYWYGSRLTIAEARRVAPHNNATSLQVTAAVLAGVVWALEHPSEGIVEPEELDFARVLDDRRALSRRDGRGAWRLDTARRSREAVCRGSRPRGPVAIQKHSRPLTKRTMGQRAELIGLCLYGLGRLHRFRLPPDLGRPPHVDLVFELARRLLGGGVLARRPRGDGAARARL